jgi:two-component system response regulator YesN
MYKVFIVGQTAISDKDFMRRIHWEEYGFTISGEAWDGTDAYHRILKFRPDIVFADIRIPGMNGLDLTRKIKERIPDIQFVLISECREFSYAQKALNYGAFRYFLKPVNEEEITEALRKATQVMEQADGPDSFEEESLEGIKYTPGIHANENIKRVVEYINNHYEEEITLQGLSELFHINPSYISQLFRKETGMTFKEYLTKLRISYASALLADTNLSISQITHKAGYNDYFYFIKAFKKRKGKTPKQYRNSLERSDPYSYS